MLCIFWSYHSKKEQEDDLKSVERGNGQLVRLERQLEVSDKEFTRLRHLNHALSQRFEETKTQTESEKYKLKVIFLWIYSR